MFRVPSLTLVAALFAFDVQAATSGFSVIVAGSFNTPTIDITNESDAADLTSFSLFLGSTELGIDFVAGLGINEPLGGSATLVFGDNANDDVRTNGFEISFVDFSPMESVNVGIDIDELASPISTSENYLEAFGILDGFAPAIVTAHFSDGAVASASFADAVQTASASYRLEGSARVAAPVPVPASLPLLAIGLAGLAGMRHLRSRKSA
ncbi:MAG: VPLPA-CTERM sorting domain-containing protein [Pseudomonadota bacterium]